MLLDQHLDFEERKRKVNFGVKLKDYAEKIDLLEKRVCPPQSPSQLFHHVFLTESEVDLNLLNSEKE